MHVDKVGNCLNGHISIIKFTLTLSPLLTNAPNLNLVHVNKTAPPPLLRVRANRSSLLTGSRFSMYTLTLSCLLTKAPSFRLFPASIKAFPSLASAVTRACPAWRPEKSTLKQRSRGAYLVTHCSGPCTQCTARHRPCWARTQKRNVWLAKAERAVFCYTW